jgi:release factor glutamine methyltransferase
VLARRTVERLPETGVAVDLCTGSGAIAAVLVAARPAARIVGTDVDERAVACALRNGVDALIGDLFAPVPDELAGQVDIVVACVPYVPTGALAFLQRDTLAFESTRAYDGGDDGAFHLRRVIEGSPAFLREGGALLLELGGDEAGRIGDALDRLGFVDLEVWCDDDGDVRGIEARFASSR